jgi:hypothetical protein
MPGWHDGGMGSSGAGELGHAGRLAHAELHGVDGSHRLCERISNSIMLHWGAGLSRALIAAEFSPRAPARSLPSPSGSPFQTGLPRPRSDLPTHPPWAWATASAQNHREAGSSFWQCLTACSAVRLLKMLPVPRMESFEYAASASRILHPAYYIHHPGVLATREFCRWDSRAVPVALVQPFVGRDFTLYLAPGQILRRDWMRRMDRMSASPTPVEGRVIRYRLQAPGHGGWGDREKEKTDDKSGRVEACGPMPATARNGHWFSR